MPQLWQSTLVNQQVDGTALTNSTTKTSIVAPAARWVFPPGYFIRVGQKVRIQAQGRISVAASQAITMTVHLGTIAAPVVLLASQSLGLNAATKTNVSWWLDLVLTLRSNQGTASNFMWMGVFESEANVGAAAGLTLRALLPASAPAVSSNFDCQVPHTLDLMATWGAASASNSIQTHLYSVDDAA